MLKPWQFYTAVWYGMVQNFFAETAWVQIPIKPLYLHLSIGMNKDLRPNFSSALGFLTN